MRRAGLHHIRGLTLVELVVSMAVMSILLAAMLSAIVVASHAMPDAASPAGTAIRTAEAADILVE
ncbi:MAG: type II secretion system protein, partial [bacterium]|nr:type II secretion system protein [bacterium]